jgi:regulator of sigma E protease
MDYVIMGLQLLLSLSILVVLHELGHFIPAKLFKTRVEKFYLFFNPWFSLFKFKKGDTEYGIGWLPLGGFVKISGMIDESMDTEQMKQEPKPWEFRSKPAWQRLIIMVGGVFVNVVLGIIIYSLVLFTWGDDYVSNDGLKNGFAVHPIMEELGFQDGDKILNVDGEKFENVLEINKHLLMRNVSTVEVKHISGETEIISIPEDIGYTLFEKGAHSNAFSPRMSNNILDTVIDGSLAFKSGVKKGDLILSVNQQKITYWDQLSTTLKLNTNKEVAFSFLRDNDTIFKTIKLDSVGLLGVSVLRDPNTLVVTHKDYSFLESIPEGVSKGYWILSDYASQFKYVFTKKGAREVGGFGSIAKIFPTTWNWRIFWMNTALLSFILAFMNILPIPALDGGHVMFLLYEMISGRPPSDKFLEKAQTIGILLVLSLLVYANGNDIYKAIFGG